MGKERNQLNVLENLNKIRSGQQDLLISALNKTIGFHKENEECIKAGKPLKYDVEKLEKEHNKTVESLRNELDETENLIDEIARGLIASLKKYDIKKRAKGRPQGRDEKASVRDKKIRKKYDKMLAQGFSHKHIRKTLADDEGKAESTIKSIYYSQKS